MARYTVLFSKIAEDKFDQIIRADRKLGLQIARTIDRLAAHPELGLLLKGEAWKDCRRYRAGDYRIIYRVEHSRLIVYVLTLGNRKDIYE